MHLEFVLCAKTRNGDTHSLYGETMEVSNANACMCKIVQRNQFLGLWRPPHKNSDMWVLLRVMSVGV